MAKVTIYTSDGETQVVHTKPGEDTTYYDELPFASSNVTHTVIEP